MRSLSLIRVFAALVIIMSLPGKQIMAQVSFEVAFDSVSCQGASDAVAYVINLTGTPPFTYEWYDGGGPRPETTDSIWGLPGGNYTCVVRDASPSVDSKDFSIYEPNNINIIDVSTADADCFGDSTGSIFILASQGTAPRKYSIDNGATFQPSPFFFNQPAGNYNIVVSDKNDCDMVWASNPATIDEPTELTISPPSVTHIACFGDNDGAIDVTTSGGTMPYSWTWTGPGGPYFTEDISPLAPGDYDLDVLDFNGCSASLLDVTVNEAPELTIDNVVATDELCRDDGLGTITVTASGGTGTRTYTLYIEPATYVDDNTTGNFNSLDSALYKVTVDDSPGCGPVEQGGIAVDNPPFISILSEDTTSITCNGSDNGTISVRGTGGTPPYTYTLYREPADLVASNGTGDFNNIPPDAAKYYVSVTDNNTCTPAESTHWLFVEPAPVTLVGTDTNDVTCSGFGDGWLRVLAGGGSGSYNYTLTPGGTQDSARFVDLIGGTYQVSVTDSRGCPGPTVADMVINDPDPITIDSTRIIDISCFGDNNGVIRTYAIGGTGTLVYTLNPAAGIPDGIGGFTSLPPATYDVSVTDANGCPAATANNLTVDEPTVLGLGSEDTASIRCDGNANGGISVRGTGGTPPYTYTLFTTPVTAGPSNSTGDFTGLGPSSPQSYYVEITDSRGCGPVSSSSWEFVNPAPITASGVDTTDVSCSGEGNGSLTVSAAGGTPPYSYTLNELPLTQASASFTGLNGGTYSVSVTDSRSCPSATVTDLVINDPVSISITFANKINITCADSADGQIIILATGGTDPLKYILKNPINPVDSNYTGTFGPLPDGIYSVDITDTNRCGPVNSGNLNLSNPLPITILSEDTTSIRCFGTNDGTITVRATGGTLPYTYSLTPGTYPDNGTGLFTGIVEDNAYQVSVTDANSCPPALSSSWDFVEPALITLTPLDTTDVTCAGAGDGSLTVSGSGGTAPLKYTLTPGPVTQASGSFSGLSGNTYAVSVTDSRNCPPASVTDMVVNEPAPISITSIDTNDITCNPLNDGSIIVSASGGTDTLFYTLTPGPINNIDGDFTGLSDNTYSLSITDVNGCTPATAADLVVSRPPPISIDIEDTLGISCNGFDDAYIDITASGGTGPLTYILKESGIEIDTNATGSFSNLSPGSYTVEVDDTNGCGPVTSNTFIFNEPGPLAASVNGSSSKVLTCYGDSTGTLNITVTGGYLPYTFAWTGPGGFTSTSQNISNLKAGNYNLIVTDPRGCSQTYAPIDSITGPPEFTMSVSKTDITCFGDADGAVTITASGGTPGYDYSKNGLIWQASNVFDPLNPAIYTFYTRDNNGCIVTQVDTIVQPQEIKITNENTDNGSQLCNGDSNGIITITAIGGTGMLEYSIDTGNTYQPNNIFAGLGRGEYQVYVRDANLCTVAGGKPLIQNPPLLYINAYAQQDISSCFTSPEGKLVIEGAGGSQPLDYILDLADTNQTGIFENLAQGSHDLRILDTKGCTKDTSIVINAPPTITVSTIITDVTTCYEDSSGVIAIIASGGTGLTKGYILLTDTTYSTDTVFYDSLPGGDYDFTVIDSLGCEIYPGATIDAPDTIATDSVFVFPVTCFGNTDGEIRVYGSGGTAPYEYILNPGTDTSATGIYSGLVPGDYAVTVNDARGCKPFISSTLTVIEPPVLFLDSINTVNISCGGVSDGVISIFASGGLPPYTYSVDSLPGYDTASVVTGLDPGTYYVSVKDSAGCSVSGDTVVLADPPGLNLDPSVIGNVSTCAGDSTGSITVSATGGTGALEYSIDSSNWQSSGTFSNLPAGIYIAMVRDSKTCMSSFPADTIIEPLPVTATITTTTAMIPDSGSISISASGGLPPLEFSIDSGNIFTADTFYKVVSDLYYVVVQDTNLCSYEETVFVSATPPLEVAVSKTDIDCFINDNGSITLTHVNGIGTVEYSIDGGLEMLPSGDFADLAGGMYYIHVTDSHRVYRDTVEIINPPPYDILATITPATCSRNSFDGTISHTVSGATPPYEYQWTNDSTTRDISGLEEGTYGITITDFNNCQYTDTYDVLANVNLIADAGNDTVVCYGAAIALDGSGGDEFTWSPEAGLDRIDVAKPEAIITDSIAYILFTRDITSGCSDRDTVIITVHPDRGIDAGQDTTVAPGQSITLTALGGPFSTYLWEPSDGLDSPASQTTTATVSTDITYAVTGTTEFGCPESDSMSIDIATGLTIYTGFTPNGDGINDFWDIDDIVFYPNATVKVFDRWGKVIFSSTGYADNQRWDGKYKGKDLPVGTYYYVIELKDGSDPYKGPVTIVR